MTIHFSWFILLLSLDLAHTAEIEAETSNRYCNTNSIDIYSTLDNVAQDTSLTTEEAKEKCKKACQSVYAYSPSLACTSSSQCTHTGSLCLNNYCTVRAGGFTIGTAESGCTDTDECRCRTFRHWDCAESDKRTYSDTCHKSYEFKTPSFMQTEDPVWFKLLLQEMNPGGSSNSNCGTPSKKDNQISFVDMTISSSKNKPYRQLNIPA